MRRHWKSITLSVAVTLGTVALVNIDITNIDIAVNVFVSLR